MRRPALLLALLVLAGSAQAAPAWDLNTDGVAVEAHADDHGQGVVRASVDIAASPTVIFDVILDCPAPPA